MKIMDRLSCYIYFCHVSFHMRRTIVQKMLTAKAYHRSNCSCDKIILFQFAFLSGLYVSWQTRSWWFVPIVTVSRKINIEWPYLFNSLLMQARSVSSSESFSCFRKFKSASVFNMRLIVSISFSFVMDRPYNGRMDFGQLVWKYWISLSNIFLHYIVLYNKPPP